MKLSDRNGYENKRTKRVKEATFLIILGMHDKLVREKIRTNSRFVYHKYPHIATHSLL